MLQCIIAAQTPNPRWLWEDKGKTLGIPCCSTIKRSLNPKSFTVYKAYSLQLLVCLCDTRNYGKRLNSTHSGQPTPPGAYT